MTFSLQPALTMTQRCLRPPVRQWLRLAYAIPTGSSGWTYVVPSPADTVLMALAQVRRLKVFWLCRKTDMTHVIFPLQLMATSPLGPTGHLLPVMTIGRVSREPVLAPIRAQPMGAGTAKEPPRTSPHVSGSITTFPSHSSLIQLQSRGPLPFLPSLPIPARPEVLQRELWQQWRCPHPQQQ